MRTQTRTCLASLAVLVSALISPLAASAAPVDDARKAADTAGREADTQGKNVTALNAEAARLADQLSVRMGEVDKLDDQIGNAERNAAEAEARIANLRKRFEARAVLLYRGAGVQPQQLADSENLEDLLDQLRVYFYAERSTDEEREAVNELQTVSEELREEQARLAGLRKDAATQRDQLDRANRDIQAKLADAREAQRRADAARESQRSALANAERAARASGDSAGAGRLANQRTAADRGPARQVNGIRCPIAGPVTFRNDWGDPRSGGRRHAGTDLFSPEGTPNVAVISGNVFTQNEGVGGLSVYLQGADGNTYYYTHLSRYGATGSVSAGEVIGYTGGTGNARGVIHTHFEIRLGGPNGTRINPYPTLAAVC